MFFLPGCPRNLSTKIIGAEQMTKLNACSAHSAHPCRRASAHRVMIHFVGSSLSSAVIYRQPEDLEDSRSRAGTAHVHSAASWAGPSCDGLTLTALQHRAPGRPNGHWQFYLTSGKKQRLRRSGPKPARADSDYKTISERADESALSEMQIRDPRP